MIILEIVIIHDDGRSFTGLKILIFPFFTIKILQKFKKIDNSIKMKKSREFNKRYTIFSKFEHYNIPVLDIDPRELNS